MRKWLFLVALGATSVAISQDEASTPAADEWYKASYAPLYDDKPWSKLEEIVPYYTETIHDHDDGVVYNSREWISEALQEWKIEGWIRSELAELEYDLLNPTTATFKAKWRDYYSGGNINYECAWYLSDFDDDKWLISEFATINCDEHGL